MAQKSASPVASPVRGAQGPDLILRVIYETQRDPLLDPHLETLASQDHLCGTLDPHVIFSDDTPAYSHRSLA